MRAAIQFASAIILLHYCYFQLAADALFLFLLLAYFNLIKQVDFFESIPKNLLAGFIGALLYLAKSYGFPFFIFHFILIHIFLNNNRRNAIKQLAAGFFVFSLFTFPWFVALHWKYGEWMIAFGKFNAHWNFTGKPLPGPILQPPPYAGSSSVWEDPWHVKTDNLKSVPFTTIVLYQIKVVFFNFQAWLKSIHELSFLAPAILFLSSLMCFKHKHTEWRYLLIGMLALPSGYLLLHIETRFIWATAFVFFIAGVLLMQQMFHRIKLKQWQQRIMWVFFFGSFLLDPINQLKDQAFYDKGIFDTAAQMKQQQLTGSFTSNTNRGKCIVLAYLSKNSYYAITESSYHIDELLAEIAQYKIRYYFFYYSSQQQKDIFLKTGIIKKPLKTIELQPGLIVLQFY